jgi:hypothetical protein
MRAAILLVIPGHRVAANRDPANLARRPCVKSSKAAPRPARPQAFPSAVGHSIDSPEPIYGLAVIGICNTEDVRRKSDVKPSDALILIKPLGVGSNRERNAVSRGLRGNDRNHDRNVNAGKVPSTQRNVGRPASIGKSSHRAAENGAASLKKSPAKPGRCACCSIGRNSSSKARP